MDINQVILFLEDYQKNNNNNKNNLIRGEIFIDKAHINKDIRIINSFENTKREKNGGIVIMIGNIRMKKK